MKKKYTLKNKRKFYAFIFTLTLLLVTVFYASNAYGYKETAYQQVTVREGDSLWSIAQKYGDESDVRKSVYQIKKVNHLSSSEIYAGSTLLIPME